MKPRVFIGSSSEGLNVAYAIQSNLEQDAEVTVWTQGVFKPAEFVLESLINQLKSADVGIFVFSPDDVVKMRGVEYTAVRDNVIFELGLWIGYLGRDKSFIVAPKGEALHLPSDLAGLNSVSYQPNRTDGNLEAALGSACFSISAKLKNITAKGDGLPPELKLSFVERRDLLSNKQRDILGLFENAESISFGELSKRFHGMAPSELAYRLEHLRLQAFINGSDKKHGKDLTNQTFSLTKAYEAFLSGRHSFNVVYALNMPGALSNMEPMLGPFKNLSEDDTTKNTGIYDIRHLSKRNDDD